MIGVYDFILYAFLDCGVACYMVYFQFINGLIGVSGFITTEWLPVRASEENHWFG